MTWEMISAIVGLAALLFTIFIEWPRFRSRWTESGLAVGSLIMLSASIVSIVGLVVWMAGMLSSNPALGYSTQAKIGMAMMFGGLAVLLSRSVLEDIRRKNYRLFWFGAFWLVLSLWSTIAMLYSLATESAGVTRPF